MTINASLQVVPLTETGKAFAIIDKAIAIIQSSGLKYEVGPFETWIEGERNDVKKVILQIEDFCFTQTEIEFLIYTKLHFSGGKSITTEQKIGKFKH